VVHLPSRLTRRGPTAARGAHGGLKAARGAWGGLKAAADGVARTAGILGTPLRAAGWPLWLVLGVGAALRLPALWRSPFGSDDALLFLEAARAAHERMLPATGIFNSLLALNMPLYTLLLLPFADHPLGMVALTVAANVAAVGGLYLFTARYFGRAPALLAGLLLATAPYDAWMSDFVWQQTLVIPLELATLASLYAGAVGGWRRWLAPHVVLLAALVQIYPVTASLAPLTLVGLVLARRTTRWRDAPLAMAGAAALYLPTVLFELASGGYDLPVYLGWLRAPKRLDGQALAAFAQALGPPAPGFLGPGTLYAAVAARLGWLTPVLLALWAGATLWLAARVARPPLQGAVGALRAARSGGTGGGPRAAARSSWRSAQ
jgi:hypothetical protein